MVVIVRERGGNSVPAVFGTESQASAFIRARIARGTVVHADEAASWDNLHERFEVKRINHQEAYSLDGASTNWAEEYFSRLRRAEIGIHHHIAGAYLLRYAQESSWREDNRRVSNGDQVNRIATFRIRRMQSMPCACPVPDVHLSATTGREQAPYSGKVIVIEMRTDMASNAAPIQSHSNDFVSGSSSFISPWPQPAGRDRQVLCQYRPDLGIDLGHIMLAQMRQPRRDPRGQREHARANNAQHVGPFRLDGAGLDQFAAQASGLEFV